MNRCKARGTKHRHVICEDGRGATYPESDIDTRQERQIMVLRLRLARKPRPVGNRVENQQCYERTTMDGNGRETKNFARYIGCQPIYGMRNGFTCVTCLGGEYLCNTPIGDLEPLTDC